VRGVVDDTLERLQQIVGRFARTGQPGSDRRGGA
jgi:hypothetical protein